MKKNIQNRLDKSYMSQNMKENNQITWSRYGNLQFVYYTENKITRNQKRILLETPNILSLKK